MKLVKPKFIIETPYPTMGMDMLKRIEKAGRTCYKSEGKISDTSAVKFVEMIIKDGHHSVLEHESVSVRFICDRGVTHEIVRHRIASYSQESTRYCNYSGDRFGNELSFIEPCFFGFDVTNVVDDNALDWEKRTVLVDTLKVIEKAYMKLIELKASPQEARYLLPNGTKTEIMMTANLREWRHFFTLRTSTKAHPQMREVAIPLLNAFKNFIPVVFDNITY